MASIWPSSQRVVARNARELRYAPRTTVTFGRAPDGLPWLIDVDRAHRLDLLFSTVLEVFELEERTELPERVRRALESDVATGLMGVHEVAFDPEGSDERVSVYTSRRKLKRLLGPTLLSQMLEGVGRSPEPSNSGGSAATNVASMAAREQDVELVEAVERSIRERQAKRHLLISLETGEAYSGSVRTEDRALRVPTSPYRPLVFETLAALPGVVVRAASSHGEIWRVPLADWDGYHTALTRLSQNPDGGDVSFEVPRIELLRALVSVARSVEALHKDGLVHCDIAPGNILMSETGPTSFDSLDVECGSAATAATFAWAAPEQIVGRPVDPRTDVCSLGRIATTLVDGVPYGALTTYIVPVGGHESRRVELLQAEGVFVDILESGYSRDWQMAWQAFLGKCVAHDMEQRPESAGAFADRLAELVERHPVTGTVDCPGSFGAPLMIEDAEGWSFARLVRD